MRGVTTSFFVLVITYYMMSVSRRDFPERGSLVLGIVDRIEGHGIYIKLSEFENPLEAYCPINEISNHWVRNIRSVVREGQRVVGRVLRSNEQSLHINVSIKKVSKDLYRKKQKQWRQFTQSLTLLKFVAEKIDKSLEDGRNEIEEPLTEAFGSLYKAFENASILGEEAFAELEIPEIWISPFVEIAKKNITILRKKIVYDLSLTCFDPDGIEVIRNALLSGMETAKDNKEVDIRIYTRGAPNYHLVSEAPMWDDAVSSAQIASEAIESSIKGANVDFSYKRVKKRR